MITIKCAKCGKKLIKYRKIGKGRILKCYLSRIYDDKTVKKNGKIYCSCGNLIGVIEKNYIKMRQRNFTYSGKFE